MLHHHDQHGADHNGAEQCPVGQRFDDKDHLLADESAVAAAEGEWTGGVARDTEVWF